MLIIVTVVCPLLCSCTLTAVCVFLVIYTGTERSLSNKLLEMLGEVVWDAMKSFTFYGFCLKDWWAVD